MDKQTFFQKMQDRGFHTDSESGSAYGLVRGWPVRICFGTQNKARALTAMVSTAAMDWKAVKKDIKQQMKGLGQVQPGSDCLVMTTRRAAGEEDAAVLCDQALETLLTLLEEKGLQPMTVCPLCHQGDCDVLIGLNQGCVPAHEHCLTETLEESRIRAEAGKKSGSYLAGCIGALLGGMVGCIPSILTVLWMERIYALLFALIPLAAFYGYKLLGGRLSAAARWVIIAVSLIMVYVMEFVFVVAGVMTEYEIGFGDAMFLTSLVIQQLGWGEFLVELTKSAGISFVFIALGIWIVWQQISRTPMDAVRGLERVRQTMQPMPGRAAERPAAGETTEIPACPPEPESEPAPEPEQPEQESEPVPETESQPRPEEESE